MTKKQDINKLPIKELQQETVERHCNAYLKRPRRDRLLDVGGNYQWRKDGEFHQINPEVIATLQYAVRTGDYRLYKRYATFINEQNKKFAIFVDCCNSRKGILSRLRK